MGEIKYNGRTYSGLIQANGCFVDTSNLLLATTSFRTSYSYTATEDCFVCLYVVPKENDDVHVDIDGEKVAAWWRGQAVSDETARYLRKGQTISVVNAHASYDSFIWVYGLLQGSPITFLSEYASACYDTNEREVGCWVDGKPLYQKTVHIGSLTFDTNWHNVPHGITNIDKVISCEGIMFGYDGSYKEFYPLPNYRSNTNQGIVWGIQGTSSEYVSYINNWYSATNDAYATLKYTKTTDTAGSGHLTPTGIPTHHYSTNEQIVGTYFGKTLYEKGFAIGTQSFSSGQITITNDLSNVDEVVEYGGSAKEPRDNRNIPLPYMRKAWNECITLQIMQLPNGTLSTAIVTNDSWYTSLENIKIWVRYTKTTN